MNIIDDIQFTVISNCVAADLQSIEQGNYEEIIKKMKSLPLRNQESVLEVLNMHVVRNISNEKKARKKKTSNGLQVTQQKSF